MEDLLNSSQCFNQNDPYTTIMLQDIEELTVNIQMKVFSALEVWFIKLLENEGNLWARVLQLIGTKLEN